MASTSKQGPNTRNRRRSSKRVTQKRKSSVIDSSDEDDIDSNATIKTPEKTTRSSERLQRKNSKEFRLPSREDVWKNIPSSVSPEKSLSHLKPRKLVNDYTRESNRYNLEKFYTDDKESDDFINDEFVELDDSSDSQEASNHSNIEESQEVADQLSGSSSESSQGSVQNKNSSTRKTRSKRNISVIESSSDNNSVETNSPQTSHKKRKKQVITSEDSSSDTECENASEKGRPCPNLKNSKSSQRKRNVKGQTHQNYRKLSNNKILSSSDSEEESNSGGSEVKSSQNDLKQSSDSSENEIGFHKCLSNKKRKRNESIILCSDSEPELDEKVKSDEFSYCNDANIPSVQSPCTSAGEITRECVERGNIVSHDKLIRVENGSVRKTLNTQSSKKTETGEVTENFATNGILPGIARTRETNYNEENVCCDTFLKKETTDNKLSENNVQGQGDFSVFQSDIKKDKHTTDADGAEGAHCMQGDCRSRIDTSSVRRNTQLKHTLDQEQEKFIDLETEECNSNSHKTRSKEIDTKMLSSSDIRNFLVKREGNDNAFSNKSSNTSRNSDIRSFLVNTGYIKEELKTGDEKTQVYDKVKVKVENDSAASASLETDKTGESAPAVSMSGNKNSITSTNEEPVETESSTSSSSSSSYTDVSDNESDEEDLDRLGSYSKCARAKKRQHKQKNSKQKMFQAFLEARMKCKPSKEK